MQPKNNNLDYFTSPTFRNIHSLYVLSFKNGNYGPMRDSFDRHYIPLVEIKYYNALIDNTPFFDQPVKNKQESYEKLVKIPRNDDYKTGNLLDYFYHQKYWKLIGIDLSRQISAGILQQINFVGKVEEQQKTILNFSLDLLILTE